MKIINSECLSELKNHADNSVDSIVTDPPYGLSFMGKKWDYDVPSVDIWKECLRVLKPGGHLVSFSSSRTYHRMAINVEDAGFEIRDQLMWVYGSGFPKSHNIGKAYSKKNGGLKQTGWEPKYPEGTRGAKQENGGSWFGGDGDPDKPGMKPVYEGNPYTGWGTALKPSHEPIVLARKPLSEKSVVDNVIKWGTGGINIDDSRVKYENEKPGVFGSVKKRNDHSVFSNDNRNEKNVESNPEGRFPANFVHDGSQEVLDIFPTVQKSTNYTRKKKRQWSAFANEDSTVHDTEPTLQTGGRWEPAGSAARFFYCAKVSKKERNAGLEEFEDKQQSPDGGGRTYNARCKSCGKKFIGASHTICNCDNPITDETVFVQKNNHPTVKPVALMSYLCKLITPKGGTILDCFMGSGSTGMAAKECGFDFIGIEMNEDYCKIAQARIDAWNK